MIFLLIQIGVLKLSFPCIFRSLYLIYYTNQMHIISYLWVLNMSELRV